MKKMKLFTCRRPLLLRMIWIYDGVPTCREDALKFRFQCLSWSLFHIDTVAIVSAPSASPYTSPPIASPYVRANFIRHTRRFFSDSAGSAPRERAHEPADQEEGGGNRKGRRLHLHGRVACCTGRAERCSARRLRPSGHYRRVIIILRSATRSQRASFTYRDSPRMRKRRRTRMPEERGTPWRKERAACWPARVIDRERKKIDATEKGREKNCQEWTHRFELNITFSQDIRGLFLRDCLYFFLRLKEQSRI